MRRAARRLAARKLISFAQAWGVASRWHVRPAGSLAPDPYWMERAWRPRRMSRRRRPTGMLKRTFGVLKRLVGRR